MQVRFGGGRRAERRRVVVDEILRFYVGGPRRFLQIADQLARRGRRAGSIRADHHGSEQLVELLDVRAKIRRRCPGVVERTRATRATGTCAAAAARVAWPRSLLGSGSGTVRHPPGAGRAGTGTESTVGERAGLVVLATEADAA